MQIHIPEPEVPESNAFQVEMAIVKLQKYTSPGTDLILDELIQARGRTMHSESYNLLILL
jgi:hypothetical protein